MQLLFFRLFLSIFSYLIINIRNFQKKVGEKAKSNERARIQECNSGLGFCLWNKRIVSNT